MDFIFFVLIAWGLYKLTSKEDKSKVSGHMPQTGELLKCPVCGGNASILKNKVFAQCDICQIVFFSVQEKDTAIYNYISIAVIFAKGVGLSSRNEFSNICDKYLSFGTAAETKLINSCFSRLFMETTLNLNGCLNVLNECSLEYDDKLDVLTIATEIIGLKQDQSLEKKNRPLLDQLATGLGINEEDYRKLRCYYLHEVRCPFCFSYLQGDTDSLITCSSCGKVSFHGDDKKNITLCIVSLAAIIAKADGRVIKKEIECLDHLLTDVIKLSVEERAMLSQWFNLSVKQGLDYHEYANALKNQKIELLNSIFGFLFELAYVERKGNVQKIDILDNIAKKWKISDEFYQCCLKQVEYEISIDECYKILECSVEDSFDVIKKAYRKLVMKYHPDACVGQHLTSDEKALLQKRFVEVTRAYERIQNEKFS